MSLNPLHDLGADASENYNPDIHGPRKFIVETNEANLNFVRGLYNDKIKPYLIDFNTLEIIDWKHLGMSNDVQRVSFKIKYKDPLGKPHGQWFPFERYGLRQVLLTKLRSEQYWLMLKCAERHPFGILLALEQETGVKLTMEDVELFPQGGDLYLLEAKTNSMGWYGEVYLRMN